MRLSLGEVLVGVTLASIGLLIIAASALGLQAIKFEYNLEVICGN
jgi:hypothetical protein